MSKIKEDSYFAPGWGARLAKARKAVKKTQEDLGVILGVRNTAVSKWEREGADDLKASVLNTLETRLGISSRYIKTGEEPMLIQTWNRDQMRAAYEQASGAPIDGIWLAGETGMGAAFPEGAICHFSSGLGLEHKAVVLVAPPKIEAVHDGVASPRCVLGRAIEIGSTGGKGSTWQLYRGEDRDDPGSFPPIAIDGWQVVGRVVGIYRAV